MHDTALFSFLAAVVPAVVSQQAAKQMLPGQARHARMSPPTHFFLFHTMSSPSRMHCPAVCRLTTSSNTLHSRGEWAGEGRGQVLGAMTLSKWLQK